MTGAADTAYDRDDVLDGTMSTVVLELGLLVLSALSFWLLDRYVIGCEKI